MDKNMLMIMAKLQIKDIIQSKNQLSHLDKTGQIFFFEYSDYMFLSLLKVYFHFWIKLFQMNNNTFLCG